MRDCVKIRMSDRICYSKPVYGRHGLCDLLYSVWLASIRAEQIKQRSMSLVWFLSLLSLVHSISLSSSLQDVCARVWSTLTQPHRGHLGASLN